MSSTGAAEASNSISGSQKFGLPGYRGFGIELTPRTRKDVIFGERSQQLHVLLRHRLLPQAGGFEGVAPV
jgi:hypothetical protein